MDTLTVAKMISKKVTLKSLDSSTTVICMLVEGDIEIVEVYVEEGTLNTTVICMLIEGDIEIVEVYVEEGTLNTVVYGVKDDVGV